MNEAKQNYNAQLQDKHQAPKTSAGASGKPSSAYAGDIELISFDDVQSIIPLSKSRIYALIKARKFPPPVKIGEHRACWVRHEIIAYRDERIAARQPWEGGGT